MSLSVSSPAPLRRSLVWRRQDESSFEFFQLVDAPGGHDLIGRVIAAEKGLPLIVDYRLRCCNGWRSRELELTQTYQGATRHMQMALVDDHWWVGARDRLDLAQCVDIDLALTPSTNALPINRLGQEGLAVGAEAEVSAAWVQFPSLEIVPTPQRYRRTEARSWRYSNPATDFSAEIAVDDQGLPTDYQGLWTRIAELDPPGQRG